MYQNALRKYKNNKKYKYIETRFITQYQINLSQIEELGVKFQDQDDFHFLVNCSRYFSFKNVFFVSIVNVKEGQVFVEKIMQKLQDKKNKDVKIQIDLEPFLSGQDSICVFQIHESIFIINRDESLMKDERFLNWVFDISSHVILDKKFENSS